MKEIEKLLKKYTAEELAVEIGVRASTIYFWKSGKHKPSKLALEKIKSLVALKKFKV